MGLLAKCEEAWSIREEDRRKQEFLDRFRHAVRTTSIDDAVSSGFHVPAAISKEKEMQFKAPFIDRQADRMVTPGITLRVLGERIEVLLACGRFICDSPEDFGKKMKVLGQELLDTELARRKELDKK